MCESRGESRGVNLEKLGPSSLPLAIPRISCPTLRCIHDIAVTYDICVI
jgi:hypothetical protein